VRHILSSLVKAAVLASGIGVALVAQGTPPAAPVITLDKAMPAPAWAYAEQALLRATELRANFSEAWNNLSVALKQTGQLDAAINAARSMASAAAGSDAGWLSHLIKCRTSAA
jgi:hypothetical protein